MEFPTFAHLHRCFSWPQIPRDALVMNAQGVTNISRTENIGKIPAYLPLLWITDEPKALNS